MSNIAIVYDDVSQAGTYSGGAWDSGLSLSKLKTYDPKEIARSDDEQEASTQFLLDLGSAQEIGIVVIVNHNLTDDASVRFRIGPNTDGSSALIDTTLDVGDFGSFIPAAGKVLFYIAADAVTARYVLCEISDEYNPDGYVQLGRHIVGALFQPAANVTFGAQIALIDQSRNSRAVDGTLYSDIAPKRRSISGAFDTLTDAEGIGQVYDMQNEVGLTLPVFAVLDPALTGSQLQRASIYGVFSELSPIVFRSVGSEDISTWQFSLDERN